MKNWHLRLVLCSKVTNEENALNNSHGNREVSELLFWSANCCLCPAVIPVILGRWAWDITTWRGTLSSAPPLTWTSCGRWSASRRGSTTARSPMARRPSSTSCALWVIRSDTGCVRHQNQDWNPLTLVWMRLHLQGSDVLTDIVCSCGSVVEHCVSSAKGCGFDPHILIKKKIITWMQL